MIVLGMMFYACDTARTPEEEPDQPIEEPENPDEPDEPTEPEEPSVQAKPVVLWIDAEANFSRLSTQAGIKRYLDMAQDAGFNAIVVDVKPVQGDVLYDSELFSHCTSLGGYTIEDRGYDYLQYFIDQARERDMRISVSTTIMTLGLPSSKSGPGYTDPYWDDKFCIEYLPDGLHDIRDTDDFGNVFAFLNPVLPEVHDYVMSLVEEVATKYEFDGYVLDYCRYMNINSDFSEASKEAFEEYSGLTVENFPEDIYTFNSDDKSDYTPGPYYNQWVEWRSSVIQGYVTDIRETLKRVKPDVDLEYWAASWWPLPHTGQNWASPSINSTSAYWWATPDYYMTGFANQLDIFQLGAYLNTVYGPYDVNSIEYAINRAKRIIGDDCKIFGTISSSAGFDMEEAVYLCYKETAGVMVFELSHIINNDAWDDVKAGVERAEEELGITREDSDAE